MWKFSFHHTFFILLVLAGLIVNRFDSLNEFTNFQTKSEPITYQVDDYFIASAEKKITIPVKIVEVIYETSISDFPDSGTTTLPSQYISIPPPFFGA